MVFRLVPELQCWPGQPRSLFAMRHLILAVAVLALATPAMAQNPAQIARVQRGQSCAGCNLFQGNFSGLEVRGISLRQARLRQADLSLSVMNRVSFRGADLRDVEAFGGVFSRSDFAGADLTNAGFVGAYLDGADFAGARLNGTNLSGARLTGAQGLTQRQLDAACGDEATVLPGRLHVRAC